MKQWVIGVTEEALDNDDNDEYFYYFDTWNEVLGQLAHFDGLALGYDIYRVSKKGSVIPITSREGGLDASSR